jgi:hypothetical protein
MINAITNSTVPHITINMGGSFGAGNYGMSGRAYDPRFMFAWVNAKLAVMGALSRTPKGRATIDGNRACRSDRSVAENGHQFPQLANSKWQTSPWFAFVLDRRHCWSTFEIAIRQRGLALEPAPHLRSVRIHRVDASSEPCSSNRCSERFCRS